MAVLKQFGILFVLGIAGIAMFTITSVPLVEQQLAKLSPEILAKVPPLWVLILLQGLQPNGTKKSSKLCEIRVTAV
ncbi:hypothetical protein [Nostoc sp.]|uniref:hypothetical protein n=1 Tax=Nostoc sp. TaxID=1180 RepID=UPI002FFC7A60